MPPLAERLRPSSLEEFIGQGHMVGKEMPLSLLLERECLPSLIFWGPPGSGKTTLARIIAGRTRAKFHPLSAVLSGISELRELIVAIEKERGSLFEEHHILFIDEIHRWNKAQQDALLPHVENGTITLIGATTENPSFEVIGPLLSRCKVYVLEPLSEEDLRVVARRGLKALNREMAEEALTFAIRSSDGDARRVLNTVEIAAALKGTFPSERAKASGSAGETSPQITLREVEQALQKKSLLYDKKGEEHYNVISAFIKSMRASDADAAVYYLARMYEAGEEPRFIARRMVIFSAEDVGNADPKALEVAVAAFQAFEITGQAEGWIPLAQAATYLAKAPKSRASYNAYKGAKADVEERGALSIPMHLRNAPTELMKELGYGKRTEEENLPRELKGKKYLSEK